MKEGSSFQRHIQFFFNEIDIHDRMGIHLVVDWMDWLYNYLAIPVDCPERTLSPFHIYPRSRAYGKLDLFISPSA